MAAPAYVRGTPKRGGMPTFRPSAPGRRLHGPKPERRSPNRHPARRAMSPANRPVPRSAVGLKLPIPYQFPEIRQPPRFPAWVRGALRILRPNPWIIGIGLAGELYRWYERKFDPNMPLPDGWGISCQSGNPMDIGYGTAVQYFTSCPGGSCGPGFSNPASGTVNPGEAIPLTYVQQLCARRCGPGRSTHFRGSVSMGAWNSLAGTPSGRYQQALKICPTGSDWITGCGSNLGIAICEPVHWNPWTTPQYRPMPRPLFWPDVPLPLVPRPSPVPIPFPLIPYAPGHRPRKRKRYVLAPPTKKPWDFPSYDETLDPGVGIIPGAGEEHRNPPGEDEKERKRKMNWRQTHEWLAFLEGTASKFMEIDDKTNAIYKALDWRVRRWKGRDGVWRDRDITTASRMRRIAQYLDRISFTDLMKNMIAEEIGDRVGGAIGKANDAAIRNNPYYRGITGLQYGQRFTKATWDDALEKLRAEAAAKEKPKDWYKWVPIGPNGERLDLSQMTPSETGYQAKWGYVEKSPKWDLPEGYTWQRELVKGTRQKIPWLRDTYNKRINPRRGTVEWWSRQNDSLAFVERPYYRHYGLQP